MGAVSGRAWTVGLVAEVALVGWSAVPLAEWVVMRDFGVWRPAKPLYKFTADFMAVLRWDLSGEQSWIGPGYYWYRG
jgi:hypothetical protein